MFLAIPAHWHMRPVVRLERATETHDRLRACGAGSVPEPELPVVRRPPKDDQQARKGANEQRAAHEKQLTGWCGPHDAHAAFVVGVDRAN